MLDRIFACRTQNSNAGAIPQRGNPGPAVVGDAETWSRRPDPGAPQAPLSAKPELVPPTRGNTVGQGCWFSEDTMACLPFCTYIDHSSGAKGCFCCIPICFDDCGRARGLVRMPAAPDLRARE